MKIEVIIPAFNEEGSILKVIKDIPNFVFRIIVVDNGSTDQTARIARESGAHVITETRRGYGNACLKGIAELNKDTEIVVFLDADYSDYPEDMEKLITPIKKGYDLVIGSRTLIENRGLSFVQRFGNGLACTLIRFFYRHKYSDLGPFRAIKNKSLLSLNMEDKNYGWTVEMQIKALKNGLKILEVPVRYRERFSGKSKVSGNIKGAFKAGIKILYLIFKYKWKSL